MAIPLLSAALLRTSMARAGAGAISQLVPSTSAAAAGTFNGMAKALQGTAATTRSTTNALLVWNQALQQARTQFQQTPNVSTMLTSLAGKISGEVTGALTGFVGILDALASPLKELVGLSRPAAVEQFNIALRDSYAVVGRMMTPALESMTRAVRSVGDAMAKLEPVITPALTAVGNALEDVVGEWARLIPENAATIQLMADAIASVGRRAATVATVLLNVVNALNKFVPLAMLFPATRVNPNATSAGAAVRNVTITGGTEEFARRAQEEAFKNASATKVQTPEEKTVNWLEKISEFLSENLNQDKIKELIRFVLTEGPKQVANSAPNPNLDVGIGQIAAWLLSSRTS